MHAHITYVRVHVYTRAHTRAPARTHTQTNTHARMRARNLTCVSTTDGSYNFQRHNILLELIKLNSL